MLDFLELERPDILGLDRLGSLDVVVQLGVETADTPRGLPIGLGMEEIGRRSRGDLCLEFVAAAFDNRVNGQIGVPLSEARLDLTADGGGGIKDGTGPSDRERAG